MRGNKNLAGKPRLGGGKRLLNFYPHYEQISKDLLKDFNAQKLIDG
ncbi:MAG: hypothetical protein HY505_02270 [Candidatus Yanofskybacteria bacterium]|nr:hypothetical protein [Candidatus Yanofskybacteria bacterium]